MKNGKIFKKNKNEIKDKIYEIKNKILKKA